MMKKKIGKKGKKSAGLIRMPSKNLTASSISKEQAIEELQKLLGDQVTESFIEAAGIPNKMNFAKTTNGIEFYDSGSRRPTTSYDFAEVEEIKDLDWLKDWYFAVFKKREIRIARLVDKKRTTPKGNPLIIDVVIESKDGKNPSTAHNFIVEVETRLTLY